MPTQEAKAHRVGEWASLRNTSPEIAEAIFEVAHYDEKLAEKIWEEGSDEVLIKAFEKTDKDSLFWGEQIIERKNVQHKRPRLRGGIWLFCSSVHDVIELIQRTEAVRIHRTSFQFQGYPLRGRFER